MRALPARLAMVAVAACFAGGCGGDHVERLVPGADPDHGKAMIEQRGCGGCHTISGIKGADGRVGPPLKDFEERRFIAGSLPNSPDNVVRWLQNPQQIRPGTVMPDLGLTMQQARDIAAYLYSQ